MANAYKNKKVDLTTTDLTILYTVPSETTAIIKSILVSDDSTSGDSIDVTLVNTSAAIFSLFNNKVIASDTTVELLTAPLVVEASEIIKVRATTADRLHVVMSLLEMTRA